MPWVVSDIVIMRCICSVCQDAVVCVLETWSVHWGVYDQERRIDAGYYSPPFHAVEQRSANIVRNTYRVSN